MVNYTKKWWLLGCLRRAEKIHSTRGSNTGRPVLISQDFFIEGDAEWPGLAHKYSPYPRFRLERIFAFWKKEYGHFKLKEKINEYNDIYRVCLEEGYIKKEKITRKDPSGSDVMLEFPTVSNQKAYRIRGFPLGYLQGLLSGYPKVASAAVTIAVALIGFAGSFLAGYFTAQ